MQNDNDYRLSHLEDGKGKSYSRSFIDNSYRVFIWKWEKYILKKQINRFKKNKKKINYLDFACGTGRIISFLENYAENSIGIDVSESMLKVGRTNVKKSKLIKADITHKNTLINEKFNLITSFRFFLNAQPELREKVLKEISVLLAKDGFFIFNIHMNNKCILANLIKLYLKLRNKDTSDFNTLSISEMKNNLDKVGLKIIDVYYKGIIPIYNENTKFPIWLLDILELFSSIPPFKYFSRHIVIVCSHS